jgi:hypothetical protein
VTGPDPAGWPPLRALAPAGGRSIFERPLTLRAGGSSGGTSRRDGAPGTIPGVQPGQVRLTTVRGSFAARVLEARLASEGIRCELDGALGGPYPLTVGAGAYVDVYVPAEELDDARYVMLVDEIDAVFDDPIERPRPWTSRAGPRWIALLSIVALVLVPLARAVVWAV